MTPEPPAQYQVRCRFCGDIKKGAPFLPIVNGQPDARMMKMGQMLVMHFLQDHGLQAAQILMLTGFQFEDPVVNQMLELARLGLRQATVKNYVTDEQLKEKIEESPITDFDNIRDEIEEKVFAFAKALRDFLMEVIPTPSPEQDAETYRALFGAQEPKVSV